MDRHFPRASESAVVHSFPDEDDQSLALVESLQGNKNNGGFDQWKGHQEIELRLRRDGAPAFATWFLVLLARRRGLLTHGIFGSVQPPDNKIVVNVWHGMPFKLIGLDAGWPRRQPPSPWRPQRSFAPYLQGLGPWNRTEWSSRDSPETTGCSHLPRKFGMRGGTRSPGSPHRNSATGEKRSDGCEFGNVFQLPGATEQAMDSLFERHGLKCWLKPHPMAHPSTRFAGANLEVIHDDSLGGQTLYQRLGGSDALITDYSSVWIDFLLVDRPIIFCLPDLDEYQSTRGTYLRRWAFGLPGPIVTSVDELDAALLDLAAGRDAYRRCRRDARALLHTHLDQRSTERVMAEVRRLRQQRSSARGLAKGGPGGVNRPT